MFYLKVLFICLFSFFMGAIPSAYVLVKLTTGKDLRKIGSGNIGATNAKRASENWLHGNILFCTTVLSDILKGVIPVLVAMLLTKDIANSLVRDSIITAAAIMTILGHDFMPFIKQGAGKGVSTTVGAFLLLAPIPVVIGMAAFLILRFFTKVVSKRSIIIALIISLSCIIMKISLPIIIGSLVSAVLIILRHKENIKRIINGEE
ncbi:glycerol-3-phosphate acyltransferase [Clostridium omnivorum]|uniref:Glycerol-3-phosphate acyltransferase n=1 Tax=Clostridium omnivorum TaxID=1604902 RepID=A0ABQ5N9R7_9CLOT|nr:glycerol-3-phosphate acyltransferase [Clostridium sp. E14]GLC32008.1 glycerol-3-phosphate acyltransferase [Clostridium sp. E14]